MCGSRGRPLGAEAAAASPTELHARLSYGTIDMLKLASETRATRPVHHRMTQQCMVDLLSEGVSESAFSTHAAFATDLRASTRPAVIAWFSAIATTNCCLRRSRTKSRRNTMSSRLKLMLVSAGSCRLSAKVKLDHNWTTIGPQLDQSPQGTSSTKKWRVSQRNGGFTRGTRVVRGGAPLDARVRVLPNGA